MGPTRAGIPTREAILTREAIPHRLRVYHAPEFQLPFLQKGTREDFLEYIESSFFLGGKVCPSKTANLGNLECTAFHRVHVRAGEADTALDQRGCHEHAKKDAIAHCWGLAKCLKFQVRDEFLNELVQRVAYVRRGSLVP